MRKKLKKLLCWLFDHDFNHYHRKYYLTDPFPDMLKECKRCKYTILYIGRI